jgi:hypothetical protein
MVGKGRSNEQEEQRSRRCEVDIRELPTGEDLPKEHRHRGWEPARVLNSPLQIVAARET